MTRPVLALSKPLELELAVAQTVPQSGPISGGEHRRADIAVYAVAVKLVREKPGMRVLSQDAPGGRSRSPKGEQSASLKVSRLDDTLAQVLVAGPAGKPGGASFAVEGILRVCHQMGVECSRAVD